MSGVMIRRVVVRGRVQRVGYRNWAHQTAIALALDGWVRNRFDGTVEAVFAGPAVTVEAMIEACRRGPPKAVVEHLDVEDAGAHDLALRGEGGGFVVLPTA